MFIQPSGKPSNSHATASGSGAVDNTQRSRASAVFRACSSSWVAEDSGFPHNRNRASATSREVKPARTELGCDVSSTSLADLSMARAFSTLNPLAAASTSARIGRSVIWTARNPASTFHRPGVSKQSPRARSSRSSSCSLSPRSGCASNQLSSHASRSGRASVFSRACSTSCCTGRCQPISKRLTPLEPWIMISWHPMGPRAKLPPSTVSNLSPSPVHATSRSGTSMASPSGRYRTGGTHAGRGGTSCPEYNRQHDQSRCPGNNLTPSPNIWATRPSEPAPPSPHQPLSITQAAPSSNIRPVAPASQPTTQPSTTNRKPRVSTTDSLRPWRVNSKASRSPDRKRTSARTSRDLNTQCPGSSVGTLTHPSGASTRTLPAPVGMTRIRSGFSRPPPDPGRGGPPARSR